MDLNYAWERLYSAIRSSIQSDQPLQQRLLDCYLELHTLDYENYLPRHLQQRFTQMMKAWAREPDPTGQQWAVRSTVHGMTVEEARKWLDEILKLFAEVAARRAVAEAADPLRQKQLSARKNH